MIALLPHIFAAAEEPTGIAALGIDPIAVLAQAVTFLVLFWVIKKYALSGIVETLEKRRKTIDAGVHLGLKLQEEKEKLDEQVEELIKKARIDADKIIAEGEKEAGALIKQAEQDASHKVDEMLADARVRIDKDIEAARAGLEKEVVGLIAAATEKIIGEKLDLKKDAALIERSLAGVRD